MTHNDIKVCRRSGHRSRLGCTSCKQRHVRCGQEHPTCNNCERMDLNCIYEPPPSRKSRSRSSALASASRDPISSPQPPLSPKRTSGQDSDPRNMSSGNTYGVLPDVNDEVGNIAVGRPINEADVCHRNETFSLISRNGTVEDCSSMPGSFYYPTGYDNMWCPSELGVSMADFTFLDFSPNDRDIPYSNTADAQIPQTADAVAPEIESQNSYLLKDSPGFAHALSVTSGLRSWAPGSAAIQPDVEIYLRSHFESSVAPTFSLLSMGATGWRRLQKYLLKVSAMDETAALSLLAISELYIEQNLAFDAQLRERPYQHDSISFYNLACQSLKTNVRADDLDVERRNKHLAAIFVLAWFEAMRVESTAADLSFPQSEAETVITSKGFWYPQSRLMLKCLNSVDAKVSHMGGRALLSPSSLDVTIEHRFEVENCVGNPEEDEVEPDSTTDGPVSSEAPERQPIAQRAAPANGKKPDRHLVLHQNVKMNIFNTIIQPALEFHIVSQSYIRKISSHERYQRKRNTADDEYQVITACRQYEIELKNHWRERPRVLDMTHQELSELVCNEIAQHSARIFCVYIVTFWSHFLYSHRVAWWNLPVSDVAADALDVIWQTLMQCTGQGRDSEADGDTAATTTQCVTSLHPGSLWALLLFASECKVEHQQIWAVRQIRSIGERAAVRPRIPDHKFSSQRGAQNASRIATLIQELVKRQKQKDKRVHWQDLSADIFGCHFSIV